MATFTANLQGALAQAVQAAVTTVLQQQNAPPRQPQVQLAQHPRDEDNSDNDSAENVFAELPHHRRQDNIAALVDHQLNRQYNQAEDRRWDSGFRVEILEFSGNLSTEEFLDWLSTIEEILEYKRIPQDQCVPLVASRFRNRAMACWQQIKESRRRAGKPRIDTWKRLKKHMRRAFLPYNYERTLYNKLQSLRQGARTMDEYATAFNMVAITSYSVSFRSIPSASDLPTELPPLRDI